MAMPLLRLRALFGAAVLLLGLLATMPAVAQQGDDDYQIIRDVNGSGGTVMQGGSYTLHGTVSQSTIGRIATPGAPEGRTRGLIGFWYWPIRGLTICLAPGDAEAHPGDTVVIPIRITDINGPIAPGVPFSFRLRYNRSLLSPIDDGFDCLYDAGDCLLDVSGTLTTEAIETGVIANIRFVAKLGNAEETPLTIEDLTWGEEGEQFIEICASAGRFVTLGICRVDGQIRLVQSAGPASRIRAFPNPASNQVAVEFTSREEGNATITMVDVIGRDVALLVDQAVEEDRLYRVDVDLTSIAAGNYFLVLRTPSEIKTLRLTVEQ